MQKESNISKTHVKTQAFQSAINKDDEKLAVTASNPRNEMRIKLPIACEELPRGHTLATEKTPIRAILHEPVDLDARDDEEKGDLIALLYIELIGQDKTIGIGKARKWRGVYEDSSSDESVYTPARTRNKVAIATKASTPTLITNNLRTTNNRRSSQRTQRRSTGNVQFEDTESVSTNTSIASWMARSFRNLFGLPPPQTIIVEDDEDDLKQLE